MNKNEFKILMEDFWSRDIPKFTPRELKTVFIEGSALSIVGPRRAGKTFRTYQLINELLDSKKDIRSICRVQFNDHRFANIKREELHLIDEVYYELNPLRRSKSDVYFIFDEIHRIDGWEDYILYLLDRPNHKVVVTGSTSKLLKGNIATQLRGKNFSTTLLPFSFREFVTHYYSASILESKTSSDRDVLRNMFHRYIEQGGFPGLLNLDKDFHVELLQNYWDTMLFRDIIEAHSDERINVLTFSAFAQAIIARIACPVTINKLKNNLKELGLKFSSNAFYNFIKYLEEAFVMFPVYIYSKSDAIRNRNPMKFYCVDWALASSITPGGCTDITRQFENMVFIELKRRGYIVSYYKTRKDYEIDFIATSQKSKETILIQVAYSIKSKEVFERETRGIAETCDYLKISNAYIITADEESELKLEKRIVKVVPYWKWAIQSK